ncbi:MAG: hypothetical protein M0P72_06360 [Metallibacterium scheffleri]|jgi:hypothetical protein|uniref:VOC family protein n=1 Tax=Metallibacterium scheffleri TaxID=993689 RepID=UPI0026F36544|nr:VOC family protein [Metallibacterium scheffleri]MCK9366754.1 hypothetical protein [Metallibacterium scheffleri]
MKRFHVHVNVADLAISIRYYQTLFGTAPSVVQPDYAKWMLDDPRINFAISQCGRTPGLDHLGLQAEDAEELDAIGARLRAADAVTLAEQGTTCCCTLGQVLERGSAGAALGKFPQRRWCRHLLRAGACARRRCLLRPRDPRRAGAGRTLQWPAPSRFL